MLYLREADLIYRQYSVPNQIVQEKSFISFVEALDPSYHVPSKEAIGKEMNRLVKGMQQNIAKATAIHFCTDLIVVKKGIDVILFGHHCSFCSHQDNHRHSVLLAVKQVPHPHTGEGVRDAFLSVVDKWEIPHSKISIVVTDNGSNMVKAFRHDFFSNLTDDDDADIT